MQWVVPVGLVVGFLVFRRLGQVSSAAARQLVKDGAVLVDVRSPREFSGGHLPGAINVPLQDLAGQVKRLGEKQRPVVLYCASGTRSAMAKAALRRQGFSAVHDLGAMGRW
ncbi:MAG: rhodanese-like domain-containing protein [Myxococcaceae bacterium]|nr:rhodanese-like domain-containing protein [Myxococcaceae bacterium]MCA3015965.1 rhodanese-like domain-containing protein [Myxococcaceae bacterium]